MDDSSYFRLIKYHGIFLLNSAKTVCLFFLHPTLLLLCGRESMIMVVIHWWIFVPICTYKNNGWLWHHNTRASCLHDDTGHNGRLEMTILSDNCEISNLRCFPLLYLFRVWNIMQEIKSFIAYYNIFFGHLWSNSPMIFTGYVTIWWKS